MNEDTSLAICVVALFACLALVAWALAWREVRLAEIATTRPTPTATDTWIPLPGPESGVMH